MAKFPDDISSKIESSKSDKLSQSRLWDLCTLFVEGRQWLDLGSDNASFSLDLRRRKDGAQRQTVNLLLNVYRNILSRLTLSYPSVVVLPSSPSNDDIIKAQSSELALRYYWSNDEIESKLNDAIQWLLITGTVGLHTFYDGSDDRVHTDVVSPYDLVFESKVTRVSDSQWVGIRSFHLIDDLKEAYPDHADELTEFGGTSEPGNQGLHTVPDDRAEVYEIYWRDGRHAIVTGDVYLYKGKWATRTFPVQVMRYTEIPGRLWGLGLMQPLLDLQRLYNEQRTQVVHNVALMGNPKWAIPKTAGVNAAALTNKPGEKVYYNPAGGAPQQIQPVPLPSYVLDSITRTQAEMNDVAGIHSVTMGKRAVGVSSGRAMQVLTERDTSQLQTTQANVERGVRKMATAVLETMKLFYTEEKMARMLDQTGRVVFRAISSETIVDEPEVFIEAGSAFRYESRDRDQQVMDLFSAGLIQPDAALQELTFRTGNAYITQKIQSLAHAQMLLDSVMQGYAIEIFATDDIKAMLKTFKDFIQTDEFYEMPEDRQLYTRDVVVALENPGVDQAAYQQAQFNQQIFPRKMQPKATLSEGIGLIVGAGSEGVRGQMAEAAANTVKDANIAESATSALASGQEALISPAMGGMG
jgi:hypothetical protein